MIHIEPLQPGDENAAFELALSHVPAQQRSSQLQQCLTMMKNGVLDARGIWVARAGGTLVAVQVCVPLGGAACLFWLPSTTDTTADLLIQAGQAWSHAGGCKVAQALAPPDHGDWAVPLVRCGFRPITRLQQWVLDIPAMPTPPATRLRFESYRPELAADFAGTLERTYQGTLDCPELNGVRTIDEIIDGHRAQGKFHADFWLLIYDGDRTVGVILLVEMPDGVTWELAYLGIVPECRGHGFARDLVMHALHALHTRPAMRVILAVDERNLPARRLYQSLGFHEVESSDVFLHIF